MAKPINQTSAKGEMEPRVLARGGAINQVPMGNAKARDVGGGGPGTGCTVYGSGAEATWNGPLRPTPTPSPPTAKPMRSEGEIFPGFPGRK